MATPMKVRRTIAVMTAKRSRKTIKTLEAHVSYLRRHALKADSRHESIRIGYVQRLRTSLDTTDQVIRRCLLHSWQSVRRSSCKLPRCVLLIRCVAQIVSRELDGVFRNDGEGLSCSIDAARHGSHSVDGGVDGLHVDETLCPSEV